MESKSALGTRRHRSARQRVGRYVKLARAGMLWSRGCCDRPRILLDLDHEGFLTFDKGRHGYNTIKFLALAGFHPVLPESAGLHQMLGQKYGQLLLEDAELRSKVTIRVKGLALGKRDARIMLSTSQQASLPEFAGSTVRLHLRGDWPTGSGSTIALPMPMHPRHYCGRSIDALDDARRTRSWAQPRPYRAMFAGNVEQDAYNRPMTLRGQTFAARYHIVQDLLESGLGHEVTGELSTAGGDSPALRDQCLIVDASKCRIPTHRWLSTLQSTDFYIALPGVDNPFCHNIAEAMAMGAIPITPYGRLFTPPLTDGVDCLAFSGRDISPAVKRALAMSPEEIHRMRANVASYFDHWMSPRSFGQRLLHVVDRHKQVTLDAPFFAVAAMPATQNLHVAPWRENIPVRTPTGVAQVAVGAAG